MPDLKTLQKMLLEARNKDLEQESMGEVPSPNAFEAIATAAKQKALENLDAANSIIGKQANMHGKMINTPDYQPTPDEVENENQFGHMLTGAVAGSLAPVEGVVAKTPFGSSILAKEAEAKALQNNMYETLPNMSQPNALKQAFANQKANRAIDAAERVRKFNELRKKMVK